METSLVQYRWDLMIVLVSNNNEKVWCNSYVGLSAHPRRKSWSGVHFFPHGAPKLSPHNVIVQENEETILSSRMISKWSQSTVHSLLERKRSSKHLVSVWFGGIIWEASMKRPDHLWIKTKYTSKSPFLNPIMVFCTIRRLFNPLKPFLHRERERETLHLSVSRLAI